MKKAWGKKIALVVIDSDGESGVAVFTGVLGGTPSEPVLEREEVEVPVPLQSEWLERIQAAPMKVREILLGAEYLIRLSIGQLPPDANIDAYKAVGLRWPE